MKLWLTAQEIADLRLCGLPTTKRRVNSLATRENWASYPARARQRDGREGGGGFEYHIDLLPMPARLDYLLRHLQVQPAPDRLAVIEADQLTRRGREVRDARLAVLATADGLRQQSGLTAMASDRYFSELYNRGAIVVDPWVRALVKKTSVRTLATWRSRASSGVSALGHDPGLARKGTGTLDTANEGKVRPFALALLAQNAHLSARHIRDVCRDEFGDTIMTRGGAKPMPPVRAFQRLIATLKSEHQVELTKLRNPDLYRSTMAPSGTGTYRHVTEPSTFWMIDASPVDALCIDGRYTIYVCIDVASRDKVLLLSRTPRASAVGLLLRKSILMMGISTAGLSIKTDNGSDFAAIATKRLCTSLGIELQFSDAYSPEQKGHVERAIRTFQHDMATTLPGYVGHSVADRTEIESRRSFAKRRQETEHETFQVSLTGPELQAYIDRWVETERHRSRDALKGRSPFQITVAAKTPIRKIDERALDVLLMPVAGKDGQRTVTKFGIRIDGRHYGTKTILPGEQVLVRMDPLDMGRILAFTPDGAQFLGEGICPELAGIDPAKYYAELRAAHSELIEGTNRQVKADMKAIAKGPAIVERVLRRREKDLPNVIAMPRRREEQSTPQIDAAIVAVETPVVPPMSPAVAAEHRRLIEQLDPSAIAELQDRFNAKSEAHETEVAARRVAHLPEGVVALPETAKERYRRAVRVRLEVEAGTADPFDAVWLGRYENTAEYRGQRAVHEDFGDAYLS